MKQVPYRGYAIIATVTQQDEVRLPRVTIRWANGRQEIQLRSTRSFVSQQDAVQFAERLAKTWVEERIGFFTTL
jgi:hypothetical protein